MRLRGMDSLTAVNPTREVNGTPTRGVGSLARTASKFSRCARVVWGRSSPRRNALSRAPTRVRACASWGRRVVSARRRVRGRVTAWRTGRPSRDRWLRGSARCAGSSSTAVTATCGVLDAEPAGPATIDAGGTCVRRRRVGRTALRAGRPGTRSTRMAGEFPHARKTRVRDMGSLDVT